MIKAVLFDLDGTLLPMDQDGFLKKYLTLLAMKTAPRGYDPKTFPKAVMAATYKMLENDGSKPNKDIFWWEFAAIYGEKVYSDIDFIDEFYDNEFDGAKELCGCNSEAKALIETLKEKGIKRILATNPVFPYVGTRRRIKWAGLSEDDFELITTYENSTYCKPNPKYFLEILEKQGLSPEECVMVGNDVDDDMPAEKIGMKVFLLTDCLINKKGIDISSYPSGGFSQLREYLLNN